MSDAAHAEAETSFDEIVAPVNHILRVGIIVSVGLAAASSYFGLWQAVGLPLDLIGLAAALIGGWPIWMEAWEAIRERQINMEITMAMGVAAALAIGEIETASVIVAFTLFSMYLEDLTKSRGKRALEVLLRGAPDKATVMRTGNWVEVVAADVQAGERVLVRGGAAVPVDGRVVEGTSTVNEAAITGEPFAKEKSKGGSVFAGTTNGGGTLEIEATRSGTDTTYARIVRLVREAGERRGKTQRLADRVAQGIVYVVLFAAVATWFGTHDRIAVVSVILVAGACGVAAGTPLAILATIAKTARRGVILNGGLAVEALAAVDTVVFDKTGTLTRGEPALERTVAADGTTDASFLGPVAAIEQGSDHPIARAIARASPGAQLASGVQYVAGRGMRGAVDGVEVIVGNIAMLGESGITVSDAAQRLAVEETKRGRIVVYAAVGGAFRGTLVLADELRPEAAASLARMRADGMRLVMLTGDGKASASDVATRLGIDEVHAELLPEDKLRIVQNLKQQGRRVLFVGDGINDAPALAEAHVGAALQSGTDAAIETADVLLMTNDLSGLGEALHESRRSQRVILFNFGGTLVVDFIGIGFAALGLIGPLASAIVHVGSELCFILNSARLFSAIGGASATSSDGTARPKPSQLATAAVEVGREP
jgi:Cu+-exporting ATPase